jgi:hypothetical protein
MGKVLHASGSGYFPECIIEQEPEPQLPYVATTLTEAMALTWRVRKWEAKVSGSIHDDSDGFRNSFNGAWRDSNSSSPFDKEEEIVCFGGNSHTENIPFYVLVTPDNPDLDPFSYDAQLDFIHGNTFTGLPPSDRKVYRVGDIYYPYIHISSALFESTYYFYPKLGTYKITFAGEEISGDIFSSYSANFSGTMSIEIRGKEYWSYGGTYNTQTGQPL